MEKINIKEKLSQINDQWNPRVAAELNGQQIRFVKIQGNEFEHHIHEEEDEMFFVIKGTIQLDFKTELIEVNEGEFIVVPKGVLHRPIAKEEAHLMMFVTNKNVNTGNVTNKFTLNTNSLNKI